MATRDLTMRFKQARSAAIRTAGAAAPAAAGYDASPLVDESPAYVDEVQGINETVEDIEAKMAKLTQLHEERKRAVMGDTSELEMQVDALTRELTAQFTRAGRRLKAMAPSIGAEDRKTAAASVRLNIQRALAVRLQTLSGTFRKAQRRYLAEMNSRKRASSFGALLGPDASGGGAAAAGEDDVDVGLSDAQVEALATATTSVTERDEEIAHIARSIEELAEIFKELNVLVVDQGTLLDRIDHNVSLTLDTMRDGVKHLETAEKYQKSARPMWCIGILMLLIIIMIGIIAARNA